MGATDAKLSEALELLRVHWSHCVGALLRDGYVLWIGSGISKECFPDLKALLGQLLEKLHARQNAADPDCPFRATSRRILDLATTQKLDAALPPATWPDYARKDLLDQLCQKYACVLNERVHTGGTSLSIPWDILKLHELYSDSGVQPDAEHRLLALLAAEGVVSEIVSANWDPLIEQAHAALAPGTALAVVACAGELNGAVSPLLFKIHGCAKRAGEDMARYKPFLLATETEIAQWTNGERHAPFRDKLATMLRQKPSLFIGLSVQDSNLRAQCVLTLAGREPFPVSPPRAIFSGTTVGPSQRNVLELWHGDDYVRNAPTMEREAALPLYAKPLLGALYVAAVLAKLRAFAGAGAAEFPWPYCATLAQEGIARLEQSLCARYDAAADPQERWRKLAAELPAALTRCLRLYLCQAPPADPHVYQPLHPHHLGAMESEAILPAAKFHWLGLALAALEAGRHHRWTLHSAAVGACADGHCRVAIGGDECVIFLPTQDRTAQRQLEDCVAILPGSGRRVLLLYPHGSQPVRRPQTPARVYPGARGMAGAPASEAWLEDLATESLSAADLLEALRDKMLAARSL